MLIPSTIPSTLSIPVERKISQKRKQQQQQKRNAEKKEKKKEKMHNGKHHGHMTPTTHTTNKLSSPSCSAKAIQTRPSPKETGDFTGGRGVRRMDNQQNNDKTERARGLDKRKDRGDMKGESNDSPEIPERRLTLGIPTAPLGFAFCRRF